MKRLLLSTLILLYSYTFILSVPASAQTPSPSPTCIPDVTQVGLCTTAGLDQQACEAIQCILQRARERPATTEWWNPSLTEFSTKVFDSPTNEIFGERYTYAQVNWIINSIYSLFLPRANKMEDIVGLFQIVSSLRTGHAPSDVQPLTDLINYPLTHPIASAKTEVLLLLSKFDLAQPAHAQGIGFSKLQGSDRLRLLWTASRNMAYLISILLLIATGFMVMFRTKINPQTVVSVQMILPKLAISLILITFSFAIVGLVLDFVYVSIVAIVGFLNLSGISTDLTGNISTLTTAGVTYFGDVFLWWYTLLAIVIILLMLFLQNFAVRLGGVVYIILTVLLAMVVWAVIAGIKIVVTLFQAYVNLLILVIIGPLQIMLDIIPGQKTGFVSWFKCVVGNASVFVITAIMAIAARVIFNFTTGPTGTGLTFGFEGLEPGFTLPFIGGGDFLLGDITQLGRPFWGGGILLSWVFIPMVFFQAMPSIMVSVRDKFCKAPDPSQQITEAVNNMIKQITGKPAKTLEQKAKEEQARQQPGLRPDSWLPWRNEWFR